MGIAAYTRGTEVLRRQLDAELSSPEAVMLRDLDAVSAAEGKGEIFQGTVARYDGERWWLMNRPDRGWGEFGRPYETLWAIARAYSLHFVSLGRDRFSLFIAVEPRNRSSVPAEAAR